MHRCAVKTPVWGTGNVGEIPDPPHQIFLGRKVVLQRTVNPCLWLRRFESYPRSHVSLDPYGEGAVCKTAGFSPPQSSTLWRCTYWPCRLTARTPDSQSGNRGSIPRGATKRMRGRAVMQRPAKAYTARAVRRCNSYRIRHIAGWSSLAARLAHTQEAVGSNPTPATFKS